MYCFLGSNGESKFVEMNKEVGKKEVWGLWCNGKGSF